jgi:hypothetical protein
MRHPNLAQQDREGTHFIACCWQRICRSECAHVAGDGNEYQLRKGKAALRNERFGNPDFAAYSVAKMRADP